MIFELNGMTNEGEDDWRDSRHPLAIRYNELGCRLVEVQEMSVAAQEDAIRMNDPLASVMFGMAWQDEVENMSLERKRIEASVENSGLPNLPSEAHNE